MVVVAVAAPSLHCPEEDTGSVVTRRQRSAHCCGQEPHHCEPLNIRRQVEPRRPVVPRSALVCSEFAARRRRSCCTATFHDELIVDHRDSHDDDVPTSGVAAAHMYLQRKQNGLLSVITATADDDSTEHVNKLKSNQLIGRCC